MPRHPSHLEVVVRLDLADAVRHRADPVGPPAFAPLFPRRSSHGREYIRGMAGFDSRRTNLGVFAIAIVSTLSGFATYLVGTDSLRVAVLGSHGAIGLSLLALLWWKGKVVLRGLRKRGRASSPGCRSSRWPCLLAMISTPACGRRWPRVGTSGRGPMLELHVGGALIIIPLFVAHLIGRWVPPAKRDLSRLVLLQGRRARRRGRRVLAGTKRPLEGGRARRRQEALHGFTPDRRARRAVPGGLMALREPRPDRPQRLAADRSRRRRTDARAFVRRPHR